MTRHSPGQESLHRSRHRFQHGLGFLAGIVPRKNAAPRPREPCSPVARQPLEVAPDFGVPGDDDRLEVIHPAGILRLR